MRPNVLLLYPPITLKERYGRECGIFGGKQIPLGIYCLASYLRDNGYAVHLIDGEAQELTEQDVLGFIREHDINVLAISSTTVAFHRAKLIAQLAKEQSPEIVTIIGGPHVSCLPRHPMQFDVFDFAVQGEGEVTMLEFLQTLEVGGNFSDVKGMLYRVDGKVVENEKRPYIDDLDSLPIPAYDLISSPEQYTPPPFNYRKKPVVNIMTSRGCPNNCTFCERSTFGQKARKKSAAKIVDEIEYVMKTLGAREIAFVDDTFTIWPDRIYEIFAMTKARGLHFPWTCMSRINTVDDKLLEFMRDTGCWSIAFGIESGDETILKTIRKNIKLEKVRKVVSKCSELGIVTKGFFIVGHPKETLETIEKTIKFACSLDLDYAMATVNTPMPGTEQFKNVDQYGVLDKTNWEDFNYWSPVFVPHGLSEELILEKSEDFLRRFYVRPRIIYRQGKMIFGSWENIKQLIGLIGTYLGFKKDKLLSFILNKKDA
ncbi:MAG: B12-binding domain-containing radical SAM protein [Pseudodesulfovibrio sp.]